MATNDFLAFAGAAGANVLSQSDYAALTSLLAGGFQAGTAQSAQFNKVLRQGSLMAAVLAQLIVDTTNQNATDDGTTTTLLSNLKAAVSARSVGLVGMARNAKIANATASSTVTFTADELVVETALGGLRYSLANVSDTFNLTTDMDTGSAPTSGFVGLYRLFNPATGAALRRIVNATSAAVPEIYAGAAPPAGFTASALVAVLPTDATGKFIPCALKGRRVYTPYRSILSTANSAASLVGISIAGPAPRNARSIVLSLQALSATVPNNATFSVSPDSGGAYGVVNVASNLSFANRTASSYVECALNGMTVYYSTSIGAGTGQFDAGIVSYDF